MKKKIFGTILTLAMILTIVFVSGTDLVRNEQHYAVGIEPLSSSVTLVNFSNHVITLVDVHGLVTVNMNIQFREHYTRALSNNNFTNRDLAFWGNTSRPSNPLTFSQDIVRHIDHPNTVVRSLTLTRRSDVTFSGNPQFSRYLDNFNVATYNWLNRVVSRTSVNITTIGSITSWSSTRYISLSEC